MNSNMMRRESSWGSLTDYVCIGQAGRTEMMTRYGVDHSQRMSPDQTVTSEGLKRGQAKPVHKWLSYTEGFKLVPARITLDDPSGHCNSRV